MLVVNLLLTAPGKFTESAPTFCAGPGEYPELSHLRATGCLSLHIDDPLATLRAVARTIDRLSIMNV